MDFSSLRDAVPDGGWEDAVNSKQNGRKSRGCWAGGIDVHVLWEEFWERRGAVAHRVLSELSLLFGKEM